MFGDSLNTHSTDVSTPSILDSLIINIELFLCVGARVNLIVVGDIDVFQFGLSFGDRLEFLVPLGLLPLFSLGLKHVDDVGGLVKFIKRIF